MLCKSVEAALQRFQYVFATIQYPVVYDLGARVSIFPLLDPQTTDMILDT